MIKAVDEFILSPFNRSGLYAYDMERDMGIEPTYPAWKAGALADVLIPHNGRLKTTPYPLDTTPKFIVCANVQV